MITAGTLDNLDLNTEHALRLFQKINFSLLSPPIQAGLMYYFFQKFKDQSIRLHITLKSSFRELTISSSSTESFLQQTLHRIQEGYVIQSLLFNPSLAQEAAFALSSIGFLERNCSTSDASEAPVLK